MYHNAPTRYPQLCQTARSNIPTTPFRFLDLPADLRLMIYPHLVTIKSKYGLKNGLYGYYSKSDSQLLRTNKQIHAEAQPLLHSLNPLQISIYLYPASSDWHFHDTCDVDVQVGLQGDSRALAEASVKGASLLKMHAFWPSYVAKARKLVVDVAVGVSVPPNPLPAGQQIYAEVEGLLVSLALVAKRCWALEVLFLDVTSYTNRPWKQQQGVGSSSFDFLRVLGGSALMKDVRRCSVDLQLTGGDLGVDMADGARLRAAVLDPAERGSTVLVRRVLDMVRRVEGVLGFVGKRGCSLSWALSVDPAFGEERAKVGRGLRWIRENEGEIFAGLYLPHADVLETSPAATTTMTTTKAKTGELGILGSWFALQDQSTTGRSGGVSTCAGPANTVSSEEFDMKHWLCALEDFLLLEQVQKVLGVLERL